MQESHTFTIITFMNKGSLELWLKERFSSPVTIIQQAVCDSPSDAGIYQVSFYSHLNRKYLHHMFWEFEQQGWLSWYGEMTFTFTFVQE